MKRTLILLALLGWGCQTQTPLAFKPAQAAAVKKPVVQRTGTAAVFPGDVNCDGSVNFDDINAFVQYLSDGAGWQAAYPGCPLVNGDLNGDGSCGPQHTADIAPFIATLNGHPTAFVISGRIATAEGAAIPGVWLRGLPGLVLTDDDGRYAGVVPAGWNGTVTPQK